MGKGKHRNVPQKKNVGQIIPIPKDVLDVINTLPEDKQQIIKSNLQVTSISQHYQGPIPPPIMMQAFEQILPGSADRILSMAEKQQKHRISMESSDMTAKNILSIAGLIMGFVGLIAMIYAGYRLAIDGYPALASIILGSIIVVTSIFVLRKIPKNSKQK